MNDSSMTESELVIRSLYRITTDYARGFGHQVEELLKLGCQRFDLDIGILSRIEDQNYTVVKTVVPSGVPLNDNDRFELGVTYCSITLEAEKPVGFEHVGQTDLATHPAYVNFQLESYVGSPVIVDNAVYGTLNFSSPVPRQRKFRDVDLDALQLMSTWVASEIYRQQTEAKLRQALKEIKTLTGLLPICSHCKKIKDDQGSWQELEHYVKENTEASFSHGVCKPCAREHYGDWFTEEQLSTLQ